MAFREGFLEEAAFQLGLGKWLRLWRWAEIGRA